MASVPSESVIGWAAHAIGPHASVTAQRSLHGEVSPWLLTVDQDGTTHDVVLRIPVAERIAPSVILTNATALLVAQQVALPAPRLIACDRTGDTAGVVASLETALPGASEFPDTLDAEQLRSVGAALARVHAIQLDPQPFLPRRTRPIQPDDFARDRRWAARFHATPHNQRRLIDAFCRVTGWVTEDARKVLSETSTTPVLQAADEHVRAYGPPREPTVFVHGDLWPGNTRWQEGRFTALIDWKTAGVGNPGVDLGSMRMQVALRYGLTAADLISEGWERQTGRPATHVAYWDAVAALNTPTMMEGWPDCDPIDHPLGAQAVTIRRDAFLRQAVDQLDRNPTPSRSSHA